MQINRGFENRISERPKSTERRICTDMDRWEKNKSNHELKENLVSRKSHASKPSKSPVIYAEYKFKTTRIM